MSFRLLLFLFATCVTYAASAQEEVTEDAVNSDLKSEKKARRDSAKAERRAWNKENTIYKPIIGVGAGVFNYFGEVNNNQRTNPLINNYGIQASIIKNFTPDWGIRFDVAFGRMSAREQTAEVFRNFSSEIVTFNILATYNFAGILPPKRFLNPFVSLGVGAVNFDAKGDLRDANGVAYNNWADGTVRNLPEPIPGTNEPNAVPIRQDYVYETDLRQANLDSLGDYAQFALTIPVTFGFNFRLSPRSNIRLSSTFSYAFTDLIDNYTRDGVEGRRGDALNDMFLLTSVSYHFDFFTPKKEKISPYDDMEFESLNVDSDGDGVSDLVDACPGTISGANVDDKGCPLDSDADGVFDYADEEPNTNPDLNVDEKGVGITDDMLSLSEEDTVATLREKMFLVYPDMKGVYQNQEPVTVNDQRTKLEQTEFWIVDTDEDGLISVDEVYNSIDLFFDGELDVNAAYINDLIDFFFDQ